MSVPDLEYIACPTSNCGGQWLPASKVRQLRESRAVFYCPSGHSQWFTGKSEIEKVKDEIVWLSKERDQYKRWYEERQKVVGAERRRQYALKGVITRLKKAG